jgi:beta-aspartyl-peptidase (threonine type)
MARYACAGTRGNPESVRESGPLCLDRRPLVLVPKKPWSFERSVLVVVVGWCVLRLVGDASLLAQDRDAAPEKPRYALALHGGAGSAPTRFSDARTRQRRHALGQALRSGQAILAAGGSSLDAVEAVVRFLEDDPRFNAGKGAVFNADGGHELDASIMDGRDRSCGAVANVSIVKNPISLARLVMTKTRHILLAGDGADRFAREMNVDLVDQDYFHTDQRYKAWQRAKEQADKVGGGRPLPMWMGTVGCVALDRSGNLAAGTSTGGLTNKKVGRIGDSPVIGAGNFADNQTCAVSCTGIGEQFMRHVAAHEIAALMKYGEMSIRQAVDHVLRHSLRPGDGGVIAVSRDGQIVMDFTTGAMACAAADSTGRFEVRWGDASAR